MLKNNYYFIKKPPKNLEVSFFCIIFVVEKETKKKTIMKEKIMDNRLRTSINHLTTGFLEEIIQLGGVGYTKESAENELKRRYEDVLKVANKYIGKCFIRVNCDSIHAYKFINHNEHSREICYEFIDIEYLQNFIACSHHDDCTVYVDDIEEMVEDSKEISEKEYNKYVEKYNKISEYVNMVVKTLSNN